MHLNRPTPFPGKASWQPLLKYTMDLHEKSIRAPLPPFMTPWEEIGPGYCYGPAFGHWDTIHQALDVLPENPGHARSQLMHYLALQYGTGMLPGVLYVREGAFHLKPQTWTHPPLWPILVDELLLLGGDEGLREETYGKLIRQIGWFERDRKAGDGFFYRDILDHEWESGVDEGVRFDKVRNQKAACIDASAHLFLLYRTAEEWSKKLSISAGEYAEKRTKIQRYIQDHLFHEEVGFFFDAWIERDSKSKALSFDGFWPMVVGAASPAQAQRLIDEHLLNPKRFLTAHPLPSVSRDEPAFTLRMWRGPVWNSMVFWVAKGCCAYQREDAARQLLEGALDSAALQFERTGKILEFYHPDRGSQADLERKPQTPFNQPCCDYLGHNPLLAMARLWDAVKPMRMGDGSVVNSAGEASGKTE
ncbi:MAG: glycoside hydrolase [Spirochaetes bacterium]|nr:glycoside hydrolase [Spirochaetota bacterium]